MSCLLLLNCFILSDAKKQQHPHDISIKYRPFTALLSKYWPRPLKNPYWSTTIGYGGQRCLQGSFPALLLLLSLLLIMLPKSPAMPLAITVPPAWKWSKNKWKASVLSTRLPCLANHSSEFSSPRKWDQVEVCISYQATGGSVLAGCLLVSICLCSPWSQHIPVSAMFSSPLLSPQLMAVTWQYGFFVFSLIQSVHFPPPPLSGEDIHVTTVPNTCHFLIDLSFQTTHFLLFCRSLFDGSPLSYMLALHSVV